MVLSVSITRERVSKGAISPDSIKARHKNWSENF